MPLNEECGMLEWVPNTLPLRNILIKGYDRREVKTYVSRSAAICEAPVFGVSNMVPKVQRDICAPGCR